MESGGSFIELWSEIVHYAAKRPKCYTYNKHKNEYLVLLRIWKESVVFIFEWLNIKAWMKRNRTVISVWEIRVARPALKKHEDSEWPELIQRICVRR